MKIRKTPKIFTLILLSSLTTACSNMYKNEYVYVDYVSASKHNQQALAKLQRKDYAGALIHYRVLEALQPNSPKIKNQIRVTHALANRHLGLEISKGMFALRNNKWETAKYHFIKALKIQPHNKIALESLRKINTREVKLVQTTHLESIKRKPIYLAEKE